MAFEYLVVIRHGYIFHKKSHFGKGNLWNCEKGLYFMYPIKSGSILRFISFTPCEKKSLFEKMSLLSHKKVHLLGVNFKTLHPCKKGILP